MVECRPANGRNQTYSAIYHHIAECRNSWRILSTPCSLKLPGPPRLVTSFAALGQTPVALQLLNVRPCGHLRPQPPQRQVSSHYQRLHLDDSKARIWAIPLPPASFAIDVAGPQELRTRHGEQ